MGDRLIFAGLDRNQRGKAHEDEERDITTISADGRTITLDKALEHKHGGIFGYPEAVPVGNLTRPTATETSVGVESAVASALSV